MDYKYAKVVLLDKKGHTIGGSEKLMRLVKGDNGFKVSDPNKNGYYNVKYCGRVNLIRLLETNKPRQIEVSDQAIISMFAPPNSNVILITTNGLLSYGLFEILSNEQYVRAQSEKKQLKAT